MNEILIICDWVCSDYLFKISTGTFRKIKRNNSHLLVISYWLHDEVVGNIMAVLNKL